MLSKQFLKWQIVFSLCLFAIFFPKRVESQSANTAATFVDFVLDVRMQSLGNSFVSFSGNNGVQELNPAGLRSYQNLGLAFTSRKWNIFRNENFFRLYQYDATYGFKKWAVAYQFRYLDFPKDDLGFRDGEEKEYYHKVSGSYDNQKGLSLGIGLKYIYSDLGSTTSVSGQQESKANVFSADFGFQYQREITSDGDFSFIPSVGASILNFGELVKYNGQSKGDPLPMRFRTGLGLSIVHNSTWNNFKVIKSNISLALSKFLVATEFDQNGMRKTFGPFESLIKSWDTFEQLDPNSGQKKRFNLGEQIIFHTGIEITFMETLSLRFGYQNGQELNNYYSIRSIGLGLDLYYVAIDFVSSNQFDDEYQDRDTPLNDNFLKAKVRIPIDGKRPKSILNLLF